MPQKRSRTAWTGALLTAALSVGALSGPSAGAVSGAPAAEGAYGYTVKIAIGEGETARACSGALVAAQWVLTAASCFADDLTNPEPPAAGLPELKSVATVGRTDLSGTGGHVSEIMELVPHADRDLVMARLAEPVTDVPTVAFADTPAAAGDSLTAAGFGRTKTEWVQDSLHTASFTVDSVDGSAVGITGSTADDSLCKGDAGGPLVREVDGVPELVGIGSRSWQGGCLGVTETRNGAVAVRTDDIADWVATTLARPWALLMAAADFNSDGKADLLTVDAADNYLYVQPGDGTGAFGRRVKVSPGKWSGMRMLAVADYTGDGKADILAANVNGNLYLYPGNGANGVTGSSVPRGGWNTIGLMAAADFNGDKKGDVVGVSGNGNLYFYAGQGTTFAAATEASTGWANMRAVVAGDFTGDGKADAYAIHDSGALYLYTGKGDGTFNGATQTGQGWQGMRLVSGADFNGDGRTDIIAINNNRGVYVYPGKAAGALGTPIVTPAPAN
ncbi:FG-GAP-like repeat-containing protein [Streptomyces sp. NBC_00247]|uniref:FG-GAP-like repeat-containing protein n=1 Tax=Streptomyces sp. NBC_00247 TaxID=2975689 RepID=UPI002E2BDC86|nr:FG-GAP-like repeat-containing protein [Streptomyces sp. NBC_00247]